jgi:hypothetical protein
MSEKSFDNFERDSVDTVYYDRPGREFLTPLELDRENISVVPKGTRANLCFHLYEYPDNQKVLGYKKGDDFFLQTDILVVPIKEELGKKERIEKDKTRFCFVLSLDEELPEKAFLYKDKKKGGYLRENKPYLYLKKNTLQNFTKDYEEKMPENVKKYMEYLKRNWNFRQDSLDFD